MKEGQGRRREVFVKGEREKKWSNEKGRCEGGKGRRGGVQKVKEEQQPEGRDERSKRAIEGKEEVKES